MTDLRTIQIFSFQGPKKANEFIALPLCTQTLPASTFGKWNVRNGPIYSWRLFLPQRHQHEDGAQMIRKGRCGKDGSVCGKDRSGRGVHLVKEGKKEGEQDVRQQTETQALTCSSSLRAGRSAWIAVLAFNFLVYKETRVEERRLIFPISLRDKSCSDIQHAGTKEAVSTKNFFCAWRT